VTTPTESPAAVGDEIEAVAYVKREHVATRSGECTFCPREDWPCRAYRLAIAVEESARLVRRKVLEARIEERGDATRERGCVCDPYFTCDGHARLATLAAELAALEER
jgi:hypothetical protein